MCDGVAADLMNLTIYRVDASADTSAYLEFSLKLLQELEDESTVRHKPLIV